MTILQWIALIADLGTVIMISLWQAFAIESEILYLVSEYGEPLPNNGNGDHIKYCIQRFTKYTPLNRTVSSFLLFLMFYILNLKVTTWLYVMVWAKAEIFGHILVKRLALEKKIASQAQAQPLDKENKEP